MNVEQIYTGCLAQGAYVISSNGEAVVIDPLRETKPYLDRAEALGLKIKYILETHFHADFVSGHVALSKATGAPIVYGPNANPEFDAHIAADGEVLKVGDVSIEVVHTPGHTMESTCYVLRNEAGEQVAIFTGDTLFLGDVGRPDLAQKAASMTQEDLAGILFDSLRTKIMTLPPSITVYPGHGAGSACGKNMSKETVGTLSEQLQTNYALRADMTREEFIREVTDGLGAPPAYFPMNVAMNKKAIPGAEEVLAEASKAFDPIAFKAMVGEMDALVLDTRTADAFAAAHIPGSIFIGIDGQFAPWVGALIPTDQTLMLVCASGRENEVITRLSRVGYDRVLGFLEGGMDAWTAASLETDRVHRITAAELSDRLHQNPALNIVDARKEGEWTAQNLAQAKNIALDDLNARFTELPTQSTMHIHCAGGYRSMIFASILKSRGIHDLVDVIGGFGAIKDTPGLETGAYVCPSTLKRGTAAAEGRGFLGWIKRLIS
ncbi:MAG: MBL fold metallo-hydrolase [Bacteroidota bacterium]|jgi:glyoxylase-like metal-dependent hydrolase (beta-lactamase superfamily II)/rhodanese-related sulfurtransferase